MIKEKAIMPTAVVMGAKMMCTCGTAPSTLIVTSQIQVKIGQQLAATVMDMNPMVNIPPFGTCNVLTAAALGVPTPCVPAPTGPWMPGSLQAKIGNNAGLISTDTLMCAIPGLISIVDPGQIPTENV
jgi:hypothetical protein